MSTLLPWGQNGCNLSCDLGIIHADAFGMPVDKPRECFVLIPSAVPLWHFGWPPLWEYPEPPWKEAQQSQQQCTSLAMIQLMCTKSTLLQPLIFPLSLPILMSTAFSHLGFKSHSEILHFWAGAYTTMSSVTNRHGTEILCLFCYRVQCKHVSLTVTEMFFSWRGHLQTW